MHVYILQKQAMELSHLKEQVKNEMSQLTTNVKLDMNDVKNGMVQQKNVVMLDMNEVKSEMAKLKNNVTLDINLEKRRVTEDVSRYKYLKLYPIQSIFAGLQFLDFSVSPSIHLSVLLSMHQHLDLAGIFMFWIK